MNFIEIVNLDKELDELIKLSIDEGFKFLDRLKTEWKSNKNTFSQKGESFFITYSDSGNCIAVCGINIDPYFNKKEIGRLRHLYIHPKYRRSGIASILVEKIIHSAREYFSVIQLRTRNPDASLFYKKIGFSDVNEEFVTHRMNLENDKH